MNTIEDTSAIQCEFSVIIESTYSGSISYTGSQLEIEVTPDIDEGTYDITFRIEVAEAGWFRDYTI